ncbi:MAG TPA: hypothetical protein PLF73_01325 [Luteimonas sp.]|nr:hypothetical protein [Luteimonas sp.]
MHSEPASQHMPSKVPEVTLGFWLIKILATTVGETAGDVVSMSMGLGYATGTAIFGVLFVVLVALQARADRFVPPLYWATIIASTTVGTTFADLLTRSVGIGYAGGSAILLLIVLAILGAWKWSLGTVSVASVRGGKSEAFYWLTIMASQTLGTALGDWVADSAGLGYVGGFYIFGGALLVVAALYRWTSISRSTLFWAAFVLTRPLGAVVGDFLDKPINHGGLALSRYTVSAALLVLIFVLVRLIPQRPATTAH